MQTTMTKSRTTKSRKASQVAGGSATQDDNSQDNIQDKRTKCEVWTRVMGYHRPVSQFNKGKKSEHYERAHFSESNTDKSKFGNRVNY